MDSEPDVNADLDSALEESVVKAAQTGGSTLPKLNLPRPGEQGDPIVQKPFPTVPTPPSVRVKKLYQLVGQAVLLPIPYGQKGPRTEGWQQVTFEQSLQAAYQEKIYECFNRGGNLGVLLGPPSDDLVDIDIDLDQYVEPFLEANPKLRATLRRRGKRGCGLLIRIEGEYPIGRWDLKLINGDKWGEWRAGGGHQSVIYGGHPETTDDGQPINYKIPVPKRTIRIRFETIVWPEWVARPFPWEKPAISVPSTGSGTNADANLDKRIRAYMAALPLAISGQAGHVAAFKVAIALIQGWGLSVDEARPYLQSYSALCEPPWTDKELEHKLSEAIKATRERPYGYLRDSELPKKRPNSTSAFFTVEETLETVCPYPAVDWAAIDKRVARVGHRFTQETIYPRKSILVPYMAFARAVCEGCDTHLLGAILPVIGALLGRRVYISWPQRNIYPNLFSLLIGPAGQRKSDAVKCASKIAWTCLPGAAFLKKHLSTEALFEEYCEENGGLPDKILLAEEANIVMATWTKTEYGARVAAEFLDLYDCGPLSESFMRNKSKKSGPGRVISETSTNVVMAGTFNVATFPVEQIKQGIQRRFMFNVSEAMGRTIHWPEKVTFTEAVEGFKPLLAFSGQIDMPKDGPVWDFWVNYQDKNREALNKLGLDNDALSARLATTPTNLLKVGMIFEACMAAYAGEENMPGQFSLESLEAADAYVDAHMKAGEFIDRYGVRKAAQEQAEVILAIVRKEFKAARPDTIYVTRSELTRRFCPHPGRRGATTPDDLYLQILSELERQGEVVRVLKEGKFEVYAFRAERNEQLEKREKGPGEFVENVEEGEANATDATNSPGVLSQKTGHEPRNGK